MLEINFDNDINRIIKDKFGRTHGIFAINKPVGMLSHDLVYAARRKLQTKKVGHAGALDPFADGLMLILVGRYTKKADMLINMDKSYECRVLFGIGTDSHDIDGEINSKDDKFELEPDKLQQAIDSLNEKYIQYVPIFSSVKVSGLKLRELARSSSKFEINTQTDPNQATFYLDERADSKMKSKSQNGQILIDIPNKEVDVTIKILKHGKMTKDEVNKEFGPVENDLYYCDLSVDCSKGTYIRQLAYDIAQKMGTTGMLFNLKRTRIGPVDLAQSISVDDFNNL